MSIDERAFEAAYKIIRPYGYVDSTRYDLLRAIEAYEAAKSSEQPIFNKTILTGTCCENGVFERPHDCKKQKPAEQPDERTALIAKALKDAREYAGYYPEWVLDQILMAEAALALSAPKREMSVFIHALVQARGALTFCDGYLNDSVNYHQCKGNIQVAQEVITEALNQIEAGKS